MTKENDMGRQDHPAGQVHQLRPNAPPEDPATRLARRLTEAINEYVESLTIEVRDEMRDEIETLHQIIENMEQGDPGA